MSQVIALRSAMRYAAKVPKKLSEELQRALLDAVVSLGNQARVAEHLQVDQATVSRWIAGRQGMDIGQCLLFAKLTQTPLVDVMRWANHDPEKYLESSALAPLSADAQSIADRARMMEWERRRRSIPERVRPYLDRAVKALITSYEDACNEAESEVH